MDRPQLTAREESPLRTEAAAGELLTERRGPLLALTLNRPSVLNSLTSGMMKGLLESLKAAEKDPDVRCVTLGASGRAFCAGADLGDLLKRQKAAPLSLGDELRDYFNPLILQIRRMEKPVVAMINGLAAGAGASLALAADLKVCAEGASFINAFIKVGLIPDSGMTFYMPRFLGYSLAIEHAWTASPVTAGRALQFGWVNRVVPVDRLQEETKTLTDALLKAPPEALALTKRAMNKSLETTLEKQLEYEAHLQEILGRTEDHKEGVAAFLEKREPRFKGN